MANVFEVLVSNLNQLGFFGFLLPWIFVFVIVYALLLKTKALGENQRIMGVLSIVVAFFVIGFGGPGLANFFVSIFGLATIILAGILVIVLFMGMSGTDLSGIAGSKPIQAVIIIIGLIIFFVAISSLGIRVSDAVFQIIFILAVIGIAVMFVTGTK